MAISSTFASLALSLAALFTVLNEARVPPSPVGQPPFLWGVAVAGYQNDGPTPNMDWYSLERDGKVPERSGKAADFRGHMEEDLDRAQSLGLNSFRMSIEWARLEPQPGKFDPAEVAYLHKLFQGLRRRGMTPVATLHHFVTPTWVADGADGLYTWENPKTVEAFKRYVTFVVKEFGHEIDYYLTFNEPSTMLGGGYAVGVLSPHRVGPVPAYRAVMNVRDAHMAAYEAIHRYDPVAMVSMPDYHCYLQVPTGQPTSPGLYYMPSAILGMLLEKTDGWDGHPRVKGLDFVSIHYYGTPDNPLQLSALPPEPYKLTVSLDHFTKILKDAYETFRLPVMIAENGFATKNDEPRADGWTRERYLVAHIQAMQQMREQGVPIMGYMHWTLTDNYEWGSYDPRFGLWSVDIRHGDLTRRETPAAEVYRQIIRDGGVSPALAAKYPPPTPQAVLGDR